MSFEESLKELAEFAKKKGELFLCRKELLAVAKELENDAVNLTTGDLVKVGDDKLCLVVAPKKENKNGLLVSLDINLERWQHENSYDPYLHGVAYNGACGLETNAVSLTDGLKNQEVVQTLSDKFEAERRNGYSPYRCPPTEYYFPAFRKCKYYGNGWYLPSIEELKRLFDNKELLTKWLGYVKRLHIFDNGKDVNLLFWSSCDNGNRKSCESTYETIHLSEALAIEIDSENRYTVSSCIKNKEAYVAPFYRF